VGHIQHSHDDIWRNESDDSGRLAVSDGRGRGNGGILRRVDNDVYRKSDDIEWNPGRDGSDVDSDRGPVGSVLLVAGAEDAKRVDGIECEWQRELQHSSQ